MKRKTQRNAVRCPVCGGHLWPWQLQHCAWCHTDLVEFAKAVQVYAEGQKTKAPRR